ncbi:hypothetical protein YC2023_018181 [Brassica napus]
MTCELAGIGCEGAGADEIGLGDNATTAPSGPYFLGRPRFFFIGTPEIPSIIVVAAIEICGVGATMASWFV